MTAVLQSSIEVVTLLVKRVKKNKTATTDPEDCNIVSG